MKFILPTSLVAGFLIFVSFIYKGTIGLSPDTESPLAAYSPLWNDAKYLKCNTAVRVTYLSEKEKELIYILNLARKYPQLFDSTVVKQYPEKSGAWNLLNIDEYKSLLDTMATIDPLPLLYPDQRCAASARCHAIISGQQGYVGHDRQDAACEKRRYYDGECCDYGHSSPLDILMGLLIDQGVPGLGHRWLCLSDYSLIGVSIQPHKGYDTNAVLDFKY